MFEDKLQKYNLIVMRLLFALSNWIYFYFYLNFFFSLTDILCVLLTTSFKRLYIFNVHKTRVSPAKDGRVGTVVLTASHSWKTQSEFMFDSCSTCDV